MEAALQDLSAWAAVEMPEARQDKAYLLRFLRGCKMRQEVARKKFRNLYEMKKQTTQWFTGRDPTDPIISNLLALGVFLPLPNKDEAGRTVILVRATLHNPRTVSMTDVFKVGMMILEAVMEDDETISENGVIVIIDLQGVSAGHGLQMTPALVRRAVHSWQDCYPIRIASIHFINCPFHVNVVLNLFRQFMREKLKRRVHTHGKDLTALHEVISTNLLPDEYQGSCGPIGEIVRQWIRVVNQKRDWFLSEEKALAAT